ncbi:MAG: cytochrome C oxidase subunit II [Deltaproteobacteria bacterium]|nr:MAG: cytochrome C oxidase subunit II [Deltaproteobacteria bacterium]
MSIYTPPADWFKAPTGGERLWVGLAVLWCIVMTIAMPYWYLYGKQNSTGEGYRVEPGAFAERVGRFVETNQVGEEAGIPIVEPAPGGDAYLMARMWAFYPIIQLRQGQTYRLHISSMDLQHGFSLQPLNMNFQILPGYDHVLTLTPTSSGQFSIVCNEYCGIGHHMMTGRILVVE